MARRSTASKKPREIPNKLQHRFDSPDNDSEIIQASSAADSIEVNVGSRLRALRKERNWSIRALAARSELAINTLSMIENGKTSPSVSTLQVLAHSLDVPITAFFEHPVEEKPIVHVRRNQRPVVSVDKNRLEHLGKNLAGSFVQPFVVTLEPGSGSGHNLILHTGHEFVYCLSGKVLYNINKEHFLLEPGDSLVFESHLPHLWQNTGEEPAQIILVFIPRDTNDEPAERHFPLD